MPRREISSFTALQSIIIHPRQTSEISVSRKTSYKSRSIVLYLFITSEIRRFAPRRSFFPRSCHPRDNEMPTDSKEFLLEHKEKTWRPRAGHIAIAEVSAVARSGKRQLTFGRKPRFPTVNVGRAVRQSDAGARKRRRRRRRKRSGAATNVRTAWRARIDC